MFPVYAVLLCILEISNAHFLDSVRFFADALLVQKIKLVLIAATAVTSSNTMRDRSVLDILLIWVAWVLITDWVPYVPPLLSSYESTLFSSLTGWVYFRPYKTIQGPVDPKNVCIAFYNGPNAPFLSRLSSHFGLPFSSVAMIVGGVAIRPSKATGSMVETTPAVLKSKEYILIDTGVKVSPEIYGAMRGLIGVKTGKYFFRTRCLKNLRPVLKCMGGQWEPKGWLIIPSLFHKQCVGNVT